MRWPVLEPPLWGYHLPMPFAPQPSTKHQPRKNMAKAYMNTAEVARHFRVTPARVREWVGKGCPCINPALKSQRNKWQHLLFKTSDVERWLSSFTQPEPVITQLELQF